jgi:hypothetical protein
MAAASPEALETDVSACRWCRSGCAETGGDPAGAASVAAREHDAWGDPLRRPGRARQSRPWTVGQRGTGGRSCPEPSSRARESPQTGWSSRRWPVDDSGWASRGRCHSSCGTNSSVISGDRILAARRSPPLAAKESGPPPQRRPRNGGVRRVCTASAGVAVERTLN